MSNVLTLETNKYAIKIENFEGPLDLLCYLIDKNKININEIKISEITQQYVEYLDQMEKMNLDIASEFIIMASTLIYLKSKSLLPRQVEEEKELTEEELIQRIIEYKKYKEITKILRDNYNNFSNRFFKFGEKVELPKLKIQKEYSKEILPNVYEKLIVRNKEKINENSSNIEKIAIVDTYTVSSKVKEIFKALIQKNRIIFNTLFSIKHHSKQEVVTAFSGLLELSRRNKVITTQNNIFDDIIVEKNKNNIKE